jgi:hypothetical protein
MNGKLIDAERCYAMNWRRVHGANGVLFCSFVYAVAVPEAGVFARGSHLSARFNSMAKLARLTEKSFHPLGTFQDLRSLSLMVLKIIGALEKSKRARGGDGFALRRRFKIPKKKSAPLIDRQLPPRCSRLIFLGRRVARLSARR